MTSPRPSSRRAGALLVVAAAVLWGTTGTTQALGPDDTTPLTVGTVRILLGGVALLALVLARPGGPGQVRALRHRRQRGALLVGAVAVAAYQVAFFAGVDRAGVALGTVVGIGSADPHRRAGGPRPASRSSAPRCCWPPPTASRPPTRWGSSWRSGPASPTPATRSPPSGPSTGTAPPPR